MGEGEYPWDICDRNKQRDGCRGASAREDDGRRYLVYFR